MGMSAQCKTSIFQTLLGKRDNISLASNAYIGLSTVQAGSSPTAFVEPSSDAGYARTLIGNYQAPTSQLFAIDSSGKATNSAIIYFPEATEEWGEIKSFGIFSSQSGGVPLVTGDLTEAVTVPANYVPLFRVGALQMSFE